MLGALLGFIPSLTAFDLAVAALCVGALIYWAGTWSFGHFAARGMPCDKPIPFFGNLASVALQRKHFNDEILEVYRRNEGRKAFGIYQFWKPTLILRDLELIKQITVKEFDSFVNHLPLSTEKADSLFSRNLFSLKDQEWRDMRATLSPAFTSSKMRNIFSLIDMCGGQMIDFLKQKVSSSGGLYEAEMKDFFTRFANDVIATTAFGIECDSLRQQDNEFYKMGRELTNFRGLRGIILLFHQLFPKVMEILKIPVSPSRVKNFFRRIIHDTIEERIKKNIFRPDMLQLLIQARQGELKSETTDEQEGIRGGRMLRLDNEDLTAQAVIFFFAGFDTVSMGLSFCVWAMTRHPEEQRRVQQEVAEVLERHGGKLTYEAVQELKYLDCFINEVFRLYAVNPAIDRICTKEFTIPADGDIPAYTIRKGDAVWVPVIGLHSDPQYWENPEKFDPDRFNDENKHKIQPFAFMPFGMGPRLCIGSRFAMMEIKVALAYMLHNFDILMTEKTPTKLELDPSDFLLYLKGGFWVAFKDRKKEI